jgi:hypothetical protein
MSKSDKELIDYLGECLSLSTPEFTIQVFHAQALLHLYKKHGETFLEQLRVRAWP